MPKKRPLKNQDVSNAKPAKSNATKKKEKQVPFSTDDFEDINEDYIAEEESSSSEDSSDRESVKEATKKETSKKGTRKKSATTGYRSSELYHAKRRIHDLKQKLSDKELNEKTAVLLKNRLAKAERYLVDVESGKIKTKKEAPKPSQTRLQRYQEKIKSNPELKQKDNLLITLRARRKRLGKLSPEDQALFDSTHNEVVAMKKALRTPVRHIFLDRLYKGNMEIQLSEDEKEQSEKPRTTASTLKKSKQKQVVTLESSEEENSPRVLETEEEQFGRVLRESAQEAREREEAEKRKASNDEAYHIEDELLTDQEESTQPNTSMSKETQVFSRDDFEGINEDYFLEEESSSSEDISEPYNEEEQLEKALRESATETTKKATKNETGKKETKKKFDLAEEARAKRMIYDLKKNLSRESIETKKEQIKKRLALAEKYLADVQSGAIKNMKEVSKPIITSKQRYADKLKSNPELYKKDLWLKRIRAKRRKKGGLSPELEALFESTQKQVIAMKKELKCTFKHSILDDLYNTENIESQLPENKKEQPEKPHTRVPNLRKRKQVVTLESSEEEKSPDYFETEEEQLARVLRESAKEAESAQVHNALVTSMEAMSVQEVSNLDKSIKYPYALQDKTVIRIHLNNELSQSQSKKRKEREDEREPIITPKASKSARKQPINVADKSSPVVNMIPDDSSSESRMTLLDKEVLNIPYQHQSIQTILTTDTEKLKALGQSNGFEYDSETNALSPVLDSMYIAKTPSLYNQYGVYAAQKISQFKGDGKTPNRIGQYAGIRGPIDEQSLSTYIFEITEIIGVDAEKERDFTGFFNHGIPNIKVCLEVINGKLQACFYPLRDIEAGEPLYFNYGGKKYFEHVTFAPFNLHATDNVYSREDIYCSLECGNRKKCDLLYIKSLDALEDVKSHLAELGNAAYVLSEDNQLFYINPIGEVEKQIHFENPEVLRTFSTDHIELHENYGIISEGLTLEQLKVITESSHHTHLNFYAEGVYQFDKKTSQVFGVYVDEEDLQEQIKQMEQSRKESAINPEIPVTTIIPKHLIVENSKWVVPKFFNAIYERNDEKLKQLLYMGVPVELAAYTCGNEGFCPSNQQQHVTALMLASYLGYENGIKLLLEYKADCDRRMFVSGFDSLKLLLMGEASHEVKVKMGLELLKRMEHPFGTDLTQNGLLHYVLKANTPELIQEIFNKEKEYKLKGADYNFKDINLLEDLLSIEPDALDNLILENKLALLKEIMLVIMKGKTRFEQQRRTAFFDKIEKRILFTKETLYNADLEQLKEFREMLNDNAFKKTGKFLREELDRIISPKEKSFTQMQTESTQTERGNKRATLNYQTFAVSQTRATFFASAGNDDFVAVKSVASFSSNSEDTSNDRSMTPGFDHTGS